MNTETKTEAPNAGEMLKGVIISFLEKLPPDQKAAAAGIVPPLSDILQHLGLLNDELCSAVKKAFNDAAGTEYITAHAYAAPEGSDMSPEIKEAQDKLMALCEAEGRQFVIAVEKLNKLGIYLSAIGDTEYAVNVVGHIRQRILGI